MAVDALFVLLTYLFLLESWTMTKSKKHNKGKKKSKKGGGKHPEGSESSEEDSATDGLHAVSSTSLKSNKSSNHSGGSQKGKSKHHPHPHKVHPEAPKPVGASATTNQQEPSAGPSKEHSDPALGRGTTGSFTRRESLNYTTKRPSVVFGSGRRPSELFDHSHRHSSVKDGARDSVDSDRSDPGGGHRHSSKKTSFALERRRSKDSFNYDQDEDPDFLDFEELPPECSGKEQIYIWLVSIAVALLIFLIFCILGMEMWCGFETKGCFAKPRKHGLRLY